jgi:hypothetical protein
MNLKIILNRRSQTQKVKTNDSIYLKYEKRQKNYMMIPEGRDVLALVK